MRYGSLCSGIEAASVAWGPLSWQCAFVAEIEPFCCAALNHHYPDVPNLGDINAADFIEKARACGPIDVLVGGPPCQAFSIAGLRGGLADARGNLTLRYIAVVDALRPRWVVYENVPGILSATSHQSPCPHPPPSLVGMECDGREMETEDEYGAIEDHAFSCFLAGLSELRYGWAYGVLDAQYFNLAQRRERVFVIGCPGDWQSSASVLFDPESMSGNYPPSREARQRITGTLSARTEGGGGLGTDFDLGGGYSLSPPLMATGRGTDRTAESHNLITAPPITSNPYGDHESREGLLITHARDVAGTLKQRMRGATDEVIDTAIAVSLRGRDGGGTTELGGEQSCALRASGGGGDKAHVLTSAVRRLTPIECERLQGFSDNYTQVPYRGKPAADGPRYKALGNSMAVPVMAYIGSRINEIEQGERLRDAAGRKA